MSATFRLQIFLFLHPPRTLARTPLSKITARDAIQRVRGGGGIRCSKTAFQAEKLFTSQTSNLQKYFSFQIKFFTLQSLRVAMRDVTI